MIKENAFFIAVAAALAVFVVIGRAPASNVDAAGADGEPQLIAATFSSAWCSACKILKPRVAKVIPDFATAPVRFVEFDFTFGQRAQTRAQAEEVGLAAVFDRFEGATGFTLLVDRDTGEIIDTLTASYSENAMRASIASALAIAEKTAPPDEFNRFDVPAN